MGDEAYKTHERWQIETSNYSGRLLAASQESPRYAGAELRHEARELIVFAVGSLSDATAALIREAPSIIRVTWREAPYTLAELTDEVLRLLTEQPATRLTGGGAHHDGTGISFTSTDAELLEAADPRRVLGARYPVTSSTETRHSPVTGLISGTSTPSAKRHRTTFFGP